MLTCIAAMAQTPVKVAAQWAKGDYAIYDNTNETTVASPMGGAPTKIVKTSEVKYTVTDARADGYTIEVTPLSKSGNGSEESGAASQLMAKWSEKLVGKTMVMETDKDGKILKVSNLEALKAEMTKAFDELTATLSTEEDKMQESVLRITFNSMMAEEHIIPLMAEGNFFDFYGKTFSTGMMEDDEVEGVKVKNTYVVMAPKNSDTFTIKSSMAVNMQKEDIKEMFVKQLKESMPDQIDAVMPQLDQMIESGMLKIEGTGSSTHVFKKNGWPQSVESSTTIGMMGTNTVTMFKSTLKESK